MVFTCWTIAVSRNSLNGPEFCSATMHDKITRIGPITPTTTPPRIIGASIPTTIHLFLTLAMTSTIPVTVASPSGSAIQPAIENSATAAISSLPLTLSSMPTMPLAVASRPQSGPVHKRTPTISKVTE